MRIALVQMPPANLTYPALGITQIRGVMKKTFGDRVAVETLYPNHDFAVHLANGVGVKEGIALYNVIFDVTTGLGDWLFRRAAFPLEVDNATAYFRRYYPGSQRAAFVERLLRVRDGLDGFMEDMIARYKLDEADIVGFSSMFQQSMASFAMARRLKERNPAVTIVMGGPNCETPMGEELVKHVDLLDYAFSGTALKSFPRFVQLTLDGKLEERDAIPGVFGKRDHERELRERGGEALDINADVPLDFDSFFDSIEAKFPSGEVDAGVTFETSRGCWWGERAHCKFCGLNGTTMEYYSMKPDKALELIGSLFERYASRTKSYWAVDNILPMEYPTKVFPFMKTPPGAQIWYEMKADVSEDAIRVMSEVGITHVQAGIESLSTSQLKAMKKGTSAFTNIRALKHFLLYGIRIDWTLLLGMPDERPEMYEHYVMNLMKLIHLTPPMGTAPIRFDRYSPYFKDAEHYGLKLRHLDYYDYIYPFGPDTVKKIAFHFYDTNFNAPYIATMMKWLKKLQQLVTLWHNRWEGREGAIIPYLYFIDNNGTPEIYDTRSGSEVRHPVTPARRKLLDYLDRNRDLTDVERVAAELGLDIAEELSFLRAHQLIWEEDERLMSIVLPRRPKARQGASPEETMGIEYDAFGRPTIGARA